MRFLCLTCKALLLAGMRVQKFSVISIAGYGLGSEMRLGKTFSINPEISGNYLYLGTWDYTNILGKLNLNLNIRLGKYVAIFGGPSFNSYYSDQPVRIIGYKPPVPPSSDFSGFEFGGRGHRWIGWNVGISFF